MKPWRMDDIEFFNMVLISSPLSPSPWGPGLLHVAFKHTGQ